MENFVLDHIKPKNRAFDDKRQRYRLNELLGFETIKNSFSVQQMEWFYVTWERHNPLVDGKAKNWKLFLKSKMYNFLFSFLFSSSSPVISLSLLLFLHLLASSFAAAAKASPSSSSSSLPLFISHTPLQPNKLTTMPPARRDQNANINASTPESTATIQVPSTMTPEQTDLIFEFTRCKLKA